MGDKSTHIPPPVDYNPALSMQAAQQTQQMTVWAASQENQTAMQTSTMQILGAQNLAAQQERLDAKLEIAYLNFQARTEEMRLTHQERLVEAANRHIETLAKNDEIELNSEDYQGGYPYQYG